jgi:hypothetical protein
MSGTLPLAHTLDSLDREKLTVLFEHRPLHKPATDALELAEVLLQSDSLALALRALDAITLSELRRFECGESLPENTAERLAERALIGRENGKPVALGEVSKILKREMRDREITAAEIDAYAEQLRSALAAKPGADGGCKTNPAGATAGNRETESSTAWYAPALAYTQRAAALLRSIDSSPGKVGRRGHIAAVTIKRFEADFGFEKDHTARDLELLRAAGLIAGTELQTLQLTEQGEAWLNQAHVDRWLTLARTVFDTLAHSFITLLAEFDLALKSTAALYAAAFPLMKRDEVEHTLQRVSDLERLGLSEGGELTLAARALAAGDQAGARAEAARSFPEPVPGIYVQPDLSVIVPGPIAIADEKKLASFVVPDQIGLASTLRITQQSLTQAFERGLTTEDLTDFLERVSLTGIPQPLAYLLTSLAEARNTITVHPYHQPGARAQVIVADSTVFKQLQLDRRLQHLRFDEAVDGPLVLLPCSRSFLRSMSQQRCVTRDTRSQAPAPLPKKKSLGQIRTRHMSTESSTMNSQRQKRPLTTW